MLQLLAMIKHQQRDFAGAIEALDRALRDNELGADGAARLIRLHLLAGDAGRGWQLLGDCCHHQSSDRLSIRCRAGRASR